MSEPKPKPKQNIVEFYREQEEAEGQRRFVKNSKERMRMEELGALGRGKWLKQFSINRHFKRRSLSQTYRAKVKRNGRHRRGVAGFTEKQHERKDEP